MGGVEDSWRGGVPVPGSVRAYSVAELRAIDREAVERYGMHPLVLMENAAAGLADGVLEVAGWRRGGVDGGVGPRVLVVAGRGHNGGDGLAAARRLHNEGCGVVAVLVEPESTLRPDAAAQLTTVRAMGIAALPADGGDPGATLREAASWLGGIDALVDALLGTGLRTGLDDRLSRVVDAMNDAGAPIVAADVPSGLEADSGEPLSRGRDGAVHAALTVTFAGMKLGFARASARRFVGRVVVRGIGVPRALLESMGRVATPGEADEGGWA